MAKKNKIYFILLMLFISLVIYAEDTRLIGNYVKLFVYNTDGSFVLYGRNNVKNNWLPLVFEDYPSTSYFRFYMNQIELPFGKGGSGNYSDIEIIDNKICYYWGNTKFKVNIYYELIPSTKEGSADTLIIDVNILNLTNTIQTGDFYLCLDTYLGEKDKTHFLLPGNQVMDKETQIVPISESEILSYFQSYNKQQDIGLNIIFNAEHQIPPSRVYVANWKRVENNIGYFKVNEGRSFDLKPYSINDSAVFIEYNNQKIYPNRDNNYRFVAGLKSAVQITNPDLLNTVNKSKENQFMNPDLTNNTEDLNELNLIDLNLNELLALLDQINKKIRGNEKLSIKDVEMANKILAEIKKRKGITP